MYGWSQNRGLGMLFFFTWPLHADTMSRVILDSALNLSWAREGLWNSLPPVFPTSPNTSRDALCRARVRRLTPQVQNLPQDKATYLRVCLHSSPCWNNFSEKPAWLQWTSGVWGALCVGRAWGRAEIWPVYERLSLGKHVDWNWPDRSIKSASFSVFEEALLCVFLCDWQVRKDILYF